MQLDAKPYTVWNLTPKGWFVISSFYNNVNERIKYPIKTIATVQLNTDEKSGSLKLISSKSV
jgi:hypothetical protein